MLLFLCVSSFLQMYIWSISSRRRNALASWDSGNPPRVKLEQRMHMFVEILAERHNPKYGWVKRVQERLAAKDVFISRDTLIRTRKKLEKDDWVYTASDAPRSGRKRKWSAVEEDAAAKKLLGSNFRRVERESQFETVSGEMKPMSQRKLKRVAEEHQLVVCEPKLVRIQEHNVHQKLARKMYCSFWLSLTLEKFSRMVYSDEMSFPVTLGVNKTNDVIVVPVGQQKTSNHLRQTKGASHACFSLWWANDESGILCYHLYTDKFSVELFHMLLKTKLQPVLEEMRRKKKPLSYFYHDKVTNSKQFDEP